MIATYYALSLSPGLLADVPVPIQVLIALMLVAAVCAFGYMWRQSNTALAAIAAIQNAWSEGLHTGTAERARGLSSVRMDGIRDRCRALSGSAADWWLAVEDHLERYGAGEHTGWFLTLPLPDILPEDETAGVIYLDDFHQSVPGMITGFGLLLTFIAILDGLSGVSAPKTGPVTGIQGLINGLSGKFLSSVVALVLSIAFALVEKKWLTLRVRRAYGGLMRTGRALFPQLGASRVLVDLQAEALKQSTSLMNISSDMVARFTSAFNQEIVPQFGTAVLEAMQGEFRPTMEAMAKTLEELHNAIERLLGEKRESIVEELHSLLNTLQKSLTSALESMSSGFRDALSGAARGEFAGAQQALSGTAEVLKSMNGQLLGLEPALRGLIDKSEQASALQVEAGHAQLRGMTELMSGLMVKLQSSASDSVSALAGRITDLLGDMNGAMAELSAKVLAATEQSNASARDAAHKVIEDSGRSSAETAARIEALLESIGDRSDDLRSSGAVLVEAQHALAGTVEQSNIGLAAFASAAKEVQEYSAALAGQGKALQALQTSHAGSLSALRETVGELSRLNRDYAQLFEQRDANLRQYAGHFETLDDRLGRALKVVNDGMHDYTVEVEKNFNVIVNVANTVVPQIAGALQAQISALEEQLDELNHALSSGVKRMHATK